MGEGGIRRVTRAGWHLKAERALHAGDQLCSCGHTMREHRELRATFINVLVNGEIVETPNPDYEPLAFHCHRDGCDCVRRERA